MTYNVYEIDYALLGNRLEHYKDIITGTSSLFLRISNIRKDRCVKLEIYMIKHRNKDCEKKPVYLKFWI